MPIIAPPIADSEFWKPNDFVFPRAINSESNVELYQSGYVVQDKKCLPSKEAIDKLAPRNIEVCECEDGSEKGGISVPYLLGLPNNSQQNPQTVQSAPAPSPDNNGIIEPFVPYYPYQTDGDCTSCCTGESNCTCANCKKPNYVVGPNGPGLVLDPSGYDPHQLMLHNLPTNLPTGVAQRDNAFDCYNKNTFTNIIQPGVYSRSEIIEPINSNIGISWDQQFEPVTCEKDCNGDITYVSRDPRLLPAEVRPLIPPPQEPSESNVYDPRFTGYGTSYRSYIEPMTGQPRFYYDDVDAIRRNNYLTRNNIDFTSFGTHFGPMTGREFENQPSVRALANNQFANDTMKFRTELQERLLRKVNRNSWQQKVAPIYKTGQCWTSAGKGATTGYSICT